MLALAIGMSTTAAQDDVLVPPPRAGAGGYALWLPNEDASLAGDIENPAWGNELTVEMWLFLSSYALVSQEYVLAELGTDWRLALNADGLVWQVQNDEISKTHAEANLAVGSWNHLAATYDAEQMSLIVNGIQLAADVEPTFTFKSRSVAAAPAVPAAGASWANKGCRAVGGGLAEGEITDCVLPFQNRGDRTVQCLPFNSANSRDDPLYDTDFRRVAGLGLWCATVSRYTSSRADDWGFCDCPFSANASFAARSGLVGDDLATLGTLAPSDTRQVAYSADVDAIDVTSISAVWVDLDNASVSIDEQVRRARSSERFAAVLTANKTLPTREMVADLAEKGASVALLYWFGEEALYPAVVSDGLTCLQVQRVQESSSSPDLLSSYRCADHAAALFGTDHFDGEAASLADAVTDCAAYPFTSFAPENAFDADTSTAWIVDAASGATETISLVYTYTTPRTWAGANKYAVVAPAFDDASAPAAWTLEALVFDDTGVYEDWVTVDAQRDVDWTDTAVRWFPVSNASALVGADTLVSAFRLRIDDIDASKPYVGLGELGVFAAPEEAGSVSPFYADGAVNASSWYASRGLLSGDAVDIAVWAVSARASPDAVALMESMRIFNDPDTLDYVLSLEPYQAAILSAARTLPDRGTLSVGRGMIGVVDNVRVWNVSRSADAIRGFSNVSLGTETAPSGLVLEWTMDEVLDPSSESDSAVCAVPMAKDASYLVSSASSAVPVAGKLSAGATLVPSTADLSGGDLVVYLASASTRRIDIDLRGYIPSEPSNERYNVGIEDRPQHGSLSRVSLANANNVDRDVLVRLGSLRYVRDNNVGSATFDEFSYRLAASRSGTTYVAKVIVHFAPPEPSASTQFTTEGAALALLQVAWPQPGFAVAAAPTTTAVPSYRLPAELDTGESFFVLTEADLVQACLTINEVSSGTAAPSAIVILDLTSLNRENLNGELDVAMRIVATANEDPTAISTVAVNAAVNLKDMDPIIPEETTLEISEDDRAAGVVLQLQSSAANSIFRIQRWPAFSTVLQADSGEVLAEISAPSIQQYASQTLRFSSQSADCDSCTIYGDPLCDLSMACRATSSWNADQLVGAPDVYPDTRDDPRGWKPRRENGGAEFVELELATAVFISAIEIYEVLNPGSIMSIKVAQDYLDANSRCYRNETSGQNVCEDLTLWTTLWTRQDSELSSLVAGLKARVFLPDICPSKAAVKYLRLELNTTQIPGWHVLDAIRVTGTSVLLPGLVTDPASRVVVRPVAGIFADDDLEYTASDCQLESSNAKVRISQSTRVASSTAVTGNATADVFADKPEILVPRGRNRTALVYSVPFEWSFLTEDLIARLGNAEGAEIPTSLRLVLRTEGAAAVTISPPLASSTTVVLELADILAPDQIALGQVSKVVVEATFEGFQVNDETRDALYRVEANLTLDCYEAFDVEDESQGRCAEDRGLLAGTCQDVWEAGKAVKTRRCSCYDNPALARLVAGEACELTMWDTCNGRGQPLVDTTTGLARCLCFNDTLYGGQYCEKRAGPVASLEDLIAEVEAIGNEILALVELEDLELVVDEPFVVLLIPKGGADSRRLADGEISAIDELNTTHTTLVSFNLTAQMDPTDTCNDHGRPTSTGDCICNGFYEQPDCFTEAKCNPGEYIVRVPNPQWTNTSDESVPEEIGACQECEPGYYCDSRVRTACEAGTFAHEAGMFYCRDQCEDQGHFMEANASAINGIQCTICPAGSWCDGRSASLCAVGTFSPQEGLTQCISCNKISTTLYADVEGLDACLSCPQNTQRINSDGVNISECVCEALFWNGLQGDPRRTGVPCYACPANGVCLGNTNAAYEDAAPPYENVSPYPLPGFWGDPAAPSKFFECPDEETCVGTDQFLCSNSSEDVFCFKCREGWYSLGDCKECPGGGGTSADAAFVVFCWGGVIAAWVILNILSNEVRALDLVLLYTQIVGIVQDFDLYWPHPVDLLNTPFEITGFEVDYFAPNCWWTSWSFINRFVLQFLMPIIYACLQLLVYNLGRLHVQYQQRRLRSPSEATHPKEKMSGLGTTSSSQSEQTILNEAEIGATLREKFGMLKAAAKRIILYFDLPDTEEDLESLRNKSIGLTFNFCLIAYPSLVVILLEPLSCIELANGTVVMQASPDIVCWESYHIYSLVIWSVLGILVYIIGIPVLQYYILTIAETRELKADPTFLERFGWMYSDFHQEVYKWECLLTFRRFAFAMVLVASSGDGYIQATIGCLVIVFCLALQVMHQPFLSRRLNILDQAGLFGSFLYIFLGVIFSAYSQESSALLSMLASPTSADGEQTDATFDEVATEVLAWFLMLVTLGIVVLGIFISYLDSRDYLRVLKAEAQLLMQGQTESVSLVRTVRRQADTRSVTDVMGLLGNLNLASAAQQTPGARNSGRAGVFSPGSTASASASLRTGSSLIGNVLIRKGSKFSRGDASSRGDKSAWNLQYLRKRASNSSSDADSLNRSSQDLNSTGKQSSSGALELELRDDLDGDTGSEQSAKAAPRPAGLDLEAQDGTDLPPMLVAVPPNVNNTSMQRSPSTDSMRGAARDDSPVRSSIKDWFDRNWRPVLASLCARRWRSTHAPVISDPSLSNLFAEIDTDGNGTITRQELQDYITNVLQMDGEAYRVQLDNLFGEYDVDQTGLIDKNEFAALINENVADLRRSELKNAIKSKYLIRWALSDLCSPLQTTLFFELDAMSRNVIKNDGPVSVYRGSRMARFYRKLIRTFPFLLDWLMVADEADLLALSRMIRQWQEAEDFVTHRGTLSRVILPQFQAPFAYWMLNKATEKDRLVFQAVLTSILTAARPELPVFERFRGANGRPSLRSSRFFNTSSAAIVRRKNHDREIAAARGIQRFYRIYKQRKAMKEAVAEAALRAQATGSDRDTIDGDSKDGRGVSGSRRGSTFHEEEPNDSHDDDDDDDDATRQSEASDGDSLSGSDDNDTITHDILADLSDAIEDEDDDGDDDDDGEDDDANTANEGNKDKGDNDSRGALSPI